MACKRAAPQEQLWRMYHCMHRAHAETQHSTALGTAGTLSKSVVHHAHLDALSAAARRHPPQLKGTLHRRAQLAQCTATISPVPSSAWIAHESDISMIAGVGSSLRCAPGCAGTRRRRPSARRAARSGSSCSGFVSESCSLTAFWPRKTRRRCGQHSARGYYKSEVEIGPGCRSS